MKQLRFNKILDINGKEKRYPKDANFIYGFIVTDLESLTDTQIDYYLYCLCTKRDYSTPDIIHVSQDVYDGVKSYFDAADGPELSQNIIPDVSAMLVFIEAARNAARLENETVGDSLKLN